MTLRSAIVVGLLAFAGVLAAPSAYAFEQDWPDPCMGYDDVFCGGGGEMDAEQVFEDCMGKIDPRWAPLRKCTAECSCKYKRDIQTCKDAKLSGTALIACERTASHNKETCDTQCYIDWP